MKIIPESNFTINRKNVGRPLLFFVIVLTFSLTLNSCKSKVELSLPEVNYGIGEWQSDKYGNFRAVVKVQDTAEAVYTKIPWRRRDQNPEKKRIIVVDGQSGEEIDNVLVGEVNREYGEILFQPSTVPGDCYVYYMPHKITGRFYLPNTIYLPYTNTADSHWKKKWEKIFKDDKNTLPKASIVELQAANEFYRADPMEIIATKEETENLLEMNEGAPYLLFPEEREYPIVMRDELPLRWIKKGTNKKISGEVHPGEYYTFQIGFYALTEVEDIRVSLIHDEDIKEENFTCFNTGGIDCAGKEFNTQLPVKSGEIQALWMGIQIPKDAAGLQKATIRIAPRGLPETDVEVRLKVSGEPLEDEGMSNLSTLSRLKWLNSTIGLDDSVFGIYTPVTKKGDEISILGRKIILGESGMPAQITSSFDDMSSTTNALSRNILSAPMKFVVECDGEEVDFNYQNHNTLKQETGAISILTKGSGKFMEAECQSKIECDGYINYSVRLKALKDCEINDAYLDIPMPREIAEYMMGLGRKGGFRPEKWDWKWDINRSNSALWMGTVGAGLQCRLKDHKDIWEVYNFKDTGIPEDWYNSGKGGCTVREEGKTVKFRAYSGKRSVKKGDELLFRFALFITPVRPLDNDHWQWRYWHTNDYENPEKNKVDRISQSGANIVNIHQGGPLNPYINYPFITEDTLRNYVKQLHSKGVRGKLYYTVRELSVYAPELFALRSFGDEVYRTGEGFEMADRFTEPGDGEGSTGESWMVEHLVDNYVPAWHQQFKDGSWDMSIAQTGLSRWHNYYLEGLNWLIKNAGIDGIYIDGSGYDREIMKRVRKVMDRAKSGCLIDFHSGNNFHPQYGLNNVANGYMELFPYINSLWLGEGFDYDNESPDYWLVEIAGIPYGLYGEMLGKGNVWRGMVYGMTNRLMWGGEPRPIWKFWDDFGIEKSQMLGYWSKRCPVKTGNKNVKATAYVNDGEMLIALANWGNDNKIKLDIDWETLSIEKSKAEVYAPEIEGIQEERTFHTDEIIPVEAKRGWFLIVSQKN